MVNAAKEQAPLSIQDLQCKLFPNQILDRLDEDLCSLLKLDKPCQHRLSKDNKNPRKGLVEVAKSNGYRLNESSKIEKEVKRFYENEGFRVNKGLSRGVMDIERGKESYSIYVAESETSWSVLVF